MISIEVILDNKLWNKKIKNRNIFFNKLVSFFPKKYKFRSKKVSFSVMLSDNKTIKKLNKKFRNKK